MTVTELDLREEAPGPEPDGRLLARLRVQAQLTQPQVADAIGDGSASTLSRIEKKTVRVAELDRRNQRFVFRACLLYRYDPREIFDITDDCLLPYERKMGVAALQQQILAGATDLQISPSR